MRRIDLRKLNPSPDWRARAQSKQSEIDNGLIEAKAASSIWSELKPQLKDLSNGKCWYCESREDRSDNAVDHFRPKSLYPWFTLDYENFRFACTYCNSIRKNPETGESGGKGDHFPLLSGARALNRVQRNTEQYLLIDPCKTTDVSLLDFYDDGRPRPKYPDVPAKNERIVLSIKYYHLDHPDLNEARRKLALDIRDWVEAGDELYPDFNTGKGSIDKAFETNLDNIARAIAFDAPFSVFAKKMVKGYQDREWIADLLECA
ncbi:HNH endonuclease [Vibrio cholerae]|uniref:HNH endonuclease n=1 Tax=Vibrio cholerae TaxID=666 RepID=UPI001B83F544|nr:HNH endonuclease [Vibrio cholerae]HDI3232703.1 HNH endonuclease [Vibrio cholerae]HDL9478573.1 HNH endonuclease [Vibrio cholerae]